MIHNLLKRIPLLALTLGLMAIGSSIRAQEKAESFGLEQAVKYALENSPVIKNSRLDLDIAKKKVWETTAIGLPHAEASFSASYMITAPGFYESFIKPGISEAYHNMKEKPKQDSASFVNEQYNKQIDDMRLSKSANLTVTQLLFSGSYIVGLQTSKIYKNLSELSITKSEQDIRESIVSSYALVLIAKENLIVLDSIFKTTQTLHQEMKKMFEQGLIEETDADQITITLGTIKNQRDMIERQVEIAERLLKFQMGIEIDKSITLTDNLQSFTSIEIPKLASNSFDVEGNVSYQLLKTQENLQKMNMKLNQSNFLPTISAYYQHEENLNKNSLTFTPPDMIGLKVSLPIFTSGQRLAQLSQAKMGYVKAQNDTYRVGQGLKLEYTQDRSAFLNAIDKFNTTKQNMDLAWKIYSRTIIKYRQGVGSSIELTQNQNQYLQNQAAYYNSIVELTSARAKFEKLLLKK